MLALFLVCVLGQAGDDPVVAQRAGLFNALKADLEAKGLADPVRLQQAREQIGRVTPDELQTVVNLYQSLKQGAPPEQVYSDAVIDRDQSVQVRDQLRLELDLKSHLPAISLASGYGYAGGPSLGAPIYGGLPAASMVPGSYGGSTLPVFNGPMAPFYGGGPLPFAGPFGFGTFSATGPVVGYSSPFMPGGPQGLTPFGP